MHIRPIRDGDETAVADLWSRCGLVWPWNDPFSDIAFARATPQAEIFICAHYDTVIASVMCGHDGYRGWDYYLAVSPDHQGEIFDRTMMPKVEDHLCSFSVAKLMLMIHGINIQVVEFYIALDYKTEPIIVMLRWLKPPAGSQHD